MTSKRSFWADLIKLNKQKAWMWILCVITMLGLFPFVMVVYLNRITMWFPTETPAQLAVFEEQMREAVCDALAFRDSVVYMLLGIVLGIGIFGYLNNRSKVDMLKSIPVKHKTMFLRDYVSGLIIYIVSYVLCSCLAIITASVWGYMNMLAFKEFIFSTFLNVMIFLFYYSLSIICICLTGNMIVAVGGILGLSFGPMLVVDTIDSFKFFFFKTATGMFDVPRDTLFPGLYSMDYGYWLKEMNDLGKEIRFMRTDLIAWVILTVAAVILSYICYMKRPSEAMHKAVYSKPLQMILKLMIIPAAALTVAVPVFQSSADSKLITAIAAVIAAFIVGMTLEGIFALDVKGAVRSIWSTALGAVLTLGLLAVFYFDLIGYDDYVPKASSIKSYAIETYPYAYGERFEFKKTDGPVSTYDMNWVNEGAYKRENMILKTTDALVKLANKSVENNYQDFQTENPDIMSMAVLYRLRGGVEVPRMIYVDINDQASLDLLDEIVGTPEFRSYLFAVIGQKDEIDEMGATILYSNGVGFEPVSVEPSDLIDSWAEDAQNFDFTKGLREDPSGKIVFKMANGAEYSLPVYDDFGNTISSIRKHGEYMSGEFNASDIDSITITNYHYEVYESSEGYYGDDPSVTVTIDDPEDIKELLKCSKPDNLTKVWKRYSPEMDSYQMNVFFNSSYEYAKKGEFFCFVFTEEVPDWVKALTE